MHYISKNVTYFNKKAATGFSKEHIKIKPVKCPKTPLGNELNVQTCFMPASYRKYSDSVGDFWMDEYSYLVVGFHNSGAELVQHIMFLLLNECNYEKLKIIPNPNERYFLIE